MSILPQLIINSIIAGAIYTMIALGFNLIYGTVKFFDLGYGALMVIGGYTMLFLTKTLELNIFLSVIISAFVAGLVSFLLHQFIYTPLRKRKASPMVFLVASLGAFTAIQAIIAILFTSQFQTLGDSSSQHVYEIFGGIMTEVQLVTLITGIVIMIVLSIVLKYTKFGKAVRAVSDDEEVSKIIGIRTNRIIGQVSFISGVIAGLAGVLIGYDTGLEPTVGLSLLLKGVVASIIGGIGNVFGGVAGSFVLSFVENFGIWKISGEWKDAIAFGVLLIFLLFRPRGIFKK